MEHVWLPWDGWRNGARCDGPGHCDASTDFARADRRPTIGVGIAGDRAREGVVIVDAGGLGQSVRWEDSSAAASVAAE